MKPFVQMLLPPSGLLLAGLMGGCVTPPSHHYTEEVVAVRTNAATQVVEKLTHRHSYWTYIDLLTQSGVEHYSFAVRNHFFLVDGQGQRSPLKFLEQRGGRKNIYPVWSVYQPLEGTNCWVRIERLFDRGASDPTARTLFVTVFNRQKLVHARAIETSEYISDYQYERHLVFESGNRLVTWKNNKDEVEYRLLEDEVNWKSNPPATKAKAEQETK